MGRTTPAAARHRSRVGGRAHPHDHTRGACQRAVGPRAQGESINDCLT
jgi:hypothetical protein